MKHSAATDRIVAHVELIRSVESLLKAAEKVRAKRDELFRKVERDLALESPKSSSVAGGRS